MTSPSRPAIAASHPGGSVESAWRNSSHSPVAPAAPAFIWRARARVQFAQEPDPRMGGHERIEPRVGVAVDHD